MTTMAEIRVPAETTVLAEAFEQLPGLEVRMENVVATEQGEVMPFVWLSGGTDSEIESALAADPTATEIRKIDETDGEYLYKVTFVDGMHILTEIIFECDGTVLEATGRNGAWTLLLRFPERENFASAYDQFERYDFDVRIRDIHTLDGGSNGRGTVTEEQHEVLRIAHEMGHYDVPRETTLDAVAEELGISRQAASERLRRAHQGVVGDYLAGDSGDAA